METIELRGFQSDAIRDLNAAMAVRGSRDIIFKSPTGSGKTIVLTHFMSEYMKDNARMVFVWLTPGKGGLEEQSKAKMDLYCHNASTKNLADVMTGGFAAGDAVFINWEKLTKKGSNALKDSERTNFKEWVQKAFNEGLAFKVVVDESHQNFTEKADEIVELFRADKIIRSSATPLEDPGALKVEVSEADVINAGLIKKLIQINPDFPSKITFKKGESQLGYLLERALEKREELRTAFAAKGSAVNPLILVQLPNSSDALLKDVEEWFAVRQIDCEGGTFAVWLADRKDNLEGIVENNAKQVAVVIKQAVATGWDCPRAHILVKLRENMDERFEIQTIGRIRRMPEACHYEDDLLDSCYLYTFDEKFTEGVRNSLGNKALDARRLFIRAELKKFKLIKEQRTMVSDTRDPVVALKAVGKHLSGKYKLDSDCAANQKKMETAGYLFKDDIWRHTQSGEATSLEEMKNAAAFNDVAFSMAIDTHRHGRAFHHEVGEIGLACGLQYEEARTIILRVFGEGGDKKECILSLPPKKLYAFVINNERKLKEDFTEAMAEELDLREASGRVSEKEFHIPHEWICTYNGKAKVQTSSEKNAYKDYPMSVAPRSTGEVSFEKWCEKTSAVDWVYRNGDKGDEYFSIVYEANSGKQKLFYPDYIVSIKGEVWVIEVKGGFNTSGESENIDIYAPKKAEAMKAYCAKHKLRGAFVCKDESEDELFAFENGFSEDVDDPGWKPIDMLFPNH